MNLFAALVNPNAPSTSMMARRHPNHRVSGLVQRNVDSKLWTIHPELDDTSFEKNHASRLYIGFAVLVLYKN